MHTTLNRQSAQAGSGRAHIDAYDFIRAVSTLTIVYFHFKVAVMDHPGWRQLPIPVQLNNGDMGTHAVLLFFMLSGATILLGNHSFGGAADIGRFYRKRARRIYPAFWMVWLYLYIQSVVSRGSVFYKGIRPIFLSLIGLDGYFAYRLDDYYFIGEWFLGAIILVYLLYPLLWLCYQRARWLTLIVLAAGAYWVYTTDVFQIDPTHNVITCLLYFYLGMLFATYRTKITGIRPLGPVCCFVSVLLRILPIPLPFRYLLAPTAVSDFIALYWLGELVSQLRGIWPAIAGFSGLSYYIYLLHHVVIVSVAGEAVLTKAGYRIECMLFVLILAETVIFSVLLKHVNAAVTGFLASSRHATEG